jgi:hypothetical protein
MLAAALPFAVEGAGEVESAYDWAKRAIARAATRPPFTTVIQDLSRAIRDSRRSESFW